MTHSLDSTSACPCDSGSPFGRCCERILNGEAASTAEMLMRSRYTAFTCKNANYLLYSWHPDTRPKTIDFDPQQRWLGLKIKQREAGLETDDRGVVCFAARYKVDGKGHRLEECSRFVRLEEGSPRVASRWVYLDGEIQ